MKKKTSIVLKFVMCKEATVTVITNMYHVESSHLFFSSNLMKTPTGLSVASYLTDMWFKYEHSAWGQCKPFKMCLYCVFVVLDP